MRKTHQHIILSEDIKGFHNTLETHFHKPTYWTFLCSYILYIDDTVLIHCALVHMTYLSSFDIRIIPYWFNILMNNNSYNNDKYSYQISWFSIGFIHDKKLSANFSLTARSRNVIIFICPFGWGKNNSRVVQ